MTAKDRRARLSLILHGILGSGEVYYEPPETVKMSYPAIVYSRSNFDGKNADNIRYMAFDKYEVTYIHKQPEDDVLERLLAFGSFFHNRSFTSDDLYHDVFTIYIQ